MSQPYSQDIRFGNSAGHNNPRAIYLDYKPSRIITTNGPPEITDGEFEWYAINTVEGILYKKTPETNGQWQEIYEFPGGSAGTVTNGNNAGDGVEVFLDKTGTLLNFRTLVSEIPFGSEEVAMVITQDPEVINFTVNRSINNATNSGASGVSLIKDVSFDFSNKGTLELKSIKAGSGINVADINNEIIISSTGSPSVNADYFSAVLNVPFPVLIIPPNSNNVIYVINSVNLIIESDPSSGWGNSLAGDLIFFYTGPNGRYYRLSIDITITTTEQSGSAVPVTIQFFIRERDAYNVLVRDIPGSTATTMFYGTDSPVLTYATGSSNFIIQPISTHTYTILAVTRTTSPVFSRAYTIEKINFTVSQI